MKELIILVAILATFACGLAEAVKEAEGPSVGILSSNHEPPTTTKPPSTCVSHWKYADPSDCSKYLLCLSGTLFSLSCPTTLHFHDAIQDCNLPEQVQCEVTTTEPPVTTTEEAACENYKRYPYPADCSKYYKCLLGVLFVMDCPLTLHYHDAIQDCNRPEVAKCQVTTDAPTTTTTEDPITTTTDDPTTTTTVDTTTTTTHDPITTTTDDPTTTSTADPTTTTTEGLTTTTAEASVTTTTAKPEPTPPTTTASTTTKRPIPGGVNCNAGMYHPHPTDCTKFYQCSNGTPYLMPCPAGLHWNTAINTCDWPAAAGCTAGK